MKTKADMVTAICRELELVGQEYNEEINTLYLGGGTPSLLSIKELEQITEAVHSNYETRLQEFSFEANPEDLDPQFVHKLRALGVDRLSIGVQTFDNPLLKSINRNHDSARATEAYTSARSAGFSNINMDLIYALPGSTVEGLRSDLERFRELAPEHISIYAFTLESRTVFENWAKKGRIGLTEEDTEAEMFEMIMDTLQAMGYEQYEVSNFARNGMYSKHNRSYWDLSDYIGIGPSAHSFINGERRVNPSHNIQYISAIKENRLPHTKEERSEFDALNEYIFTSLRTIWGCDTGLIRRRWQRDLEAEQSEQLAPWIQGGYIKNDNGSLKLSRGGLMLADQIASDLFFTDQHS